MSLWCIRLGIRIERIARGHPEQNGAHERMHGTLKTETTRPPEHTFERQQKRFDEFRYVYNNERPHEAHGQKRAVTIYRPSPQPYPESLPPIEYVTTSKTLAAEFVTLEEIDDGVWSLYYGPVMLARFDERKMRVIRDSSGLRMERSS